MIYLRYLNAGARGNWRLIPPGGRYATQAAANAGTAGDAAYVGGISNLAVNVGWWLNITTGAVQYDTPADTDVVAAHRVLHAQGLVFEETGVRLAAGYTDHARGVFHDFLFRLRQFHYLLANSDDYTAAQKIAWCQAIPRGPVDISVNGTAGSDMDDAVQRFYRRVTATNPLVAPSVPTCWVEPITGDRTNILPGVALDLPVPADADLAGGGWIDAL